MMDGGVKGRTAQSWTLLMVLFLTTLTSPTTTAKEQDPFRIYPYRLVTSTYFGRISDGVLPGSHVPRDKSLPAAYNMGENEYIRIGLIHIDHQANSGSQTNHTPTILYSLPMKISLTVGAVTGEAREKGESKVGEEGSKKVFTIDSNFYLSVSDPHALTKFSEVEFWVIAMQHDTDIASNPVAFIIKIDHTQPDNEETTIYVGIVVIVICFFALLIPFTVRTKRRMRENRPICGCGSTQEKTEAGTGSTVSHIQVPRDNQRDNLAASLYGSRSSVESDRRETFQHHMLRSDSDHHFQPRWMDPHFKHDYEHPHYKVKSPNPLDRVRQSHMGPGSPGPSSSRPQIVVGKY